MEVLLFLALLVVLIVGHEAGHLLAAKRAGMEVPEFGIGFPPKLWSRVVGTTEYSVNALPFGGFVRIVGENGDEDHPNAFSQKPKRAQLAVLAAGPVANLAIGFLAFWIAFMAGVPTAVDDAPPQGLSHAAVVVTERVPGSPAATHLEVGDRVLRIGDASGVYVVERPSDIREHVVSDAPVTLTIARGGVEETVTMSPTKGLIPDDPERYAIGVGTMLLGTVSYGPVEALFKAFEATWKSTVGIVTSFGSLLMGAFTLTASLENLSGPVGIAAMAGDAATFGVGQLLAFTALISLNLAILNLLPLPALDGGRIALIGYEALRGKKVRIETVSFVNTLGFVALIALLLTVTWHDIAKLLV